jgi:hypothetical protein
MQGYRLYFLDGAGHITAAIVIECDDDETAISRCSDHSDGRAMELWLQDRRVRSFPADPSFNAPARPSPMA